MWAFDAFTGKCRLCGSSDGQRLCGAERLFGRGQSLYRCASCAGVYLAPDFDDRTLETFYKSEYRRLFPSEAAKTYDEAYFAGSRMRSTAMARGDLLMPRLRVGARLLEIGSGFGGFLGCIHARRPDVELFAIEPDEANRHHMLGGAPVTFLKRGEIAGHGPFDAVVSFHAVEHLKDPGAWLGEVNAALAPGGFVAIEVPDVLAPWRRWTYVHPAHLSYFSRQSLGRLLERSGLAVESVGDHPAGSVLADTIWAVAGRGPSAGAPVFAPPGREEIERLDAHIFRYRWRFGTAVRTSIRRMLVAALGPEKFGSILRARRRLALVMKG